MGLEELRARVRSLVDSTDSEERLRKAEQNLSVEENIPYVDPRYEEGILRGLREVEEGRGIPAEVIIARLQERRNRHNAA